MNGLERWDAALEEAESLLGSRWRIDHGRPGMLYDRAGNERQVTLDVWYLRRAMTIGIGYANEGKA